MVYLFVKYLHILSSTVLFGTGLGTASNFLIGHRSKNVAVIAAVTRYTVFADWVFTTPSGIAQALTGFTLVYLAGYSLAAPWLYISLAGYVVAGACWLPVVYMQIKMRDMATVALKNNAALPAIYHRYFWYWFCLGWPAFISLMIVFYCMTVKPNF